MLKLVNNLLLSRSGSNPLGVQVSLFAKLINFSKIIKKVRQDSVMVNTRGSLSLDLGSNPNFVIKFIK